MPVNELREFEKNFERPDETSCWEWQSSFNGNYGTFSLPRRGKRLAHRASYQLYVGQIPDGLFVLHECDNPPCVNPRHLFLGTQLDNIRDMVNKGRLVVGKRYSGDENISRRRPEILPRGEEHHNATLTEKDVIFVLENFVPRHPDLGNTGLARRFGVLQSAISKIVRGVTWRHVPRPKREHVVVC